MERRVSGALMVVHSLSGEEQFSWLARPIRRQYSFRTIGIRR